MSMSGKKSLPIFFSLHGYNCIKEIGHGGFGVCYLASCDKYPDTEFAIKVIHDKDQTFCDQYKDELEALRLLDHPNIIKVYDFFKEGNFFFIVLEYCTNGTLESYIKINGPIREPLLSSYVQQLIDGFTYMHNKNVAHHDIKTTNILIDKYNRLKIADFGFSQKHQPNALSKVYCGTGIFVAPEIIMKKPYDPFKSDIWSLGITIYRMVTGTYPFTGKNQNSVFIAQMKGLPKGQPQNVYERLWKSMLVFEPDQRVDLIKCQRMLYSELSKKIIQKCISSAPIIKTHNSRLLNAAHTVLAKRRVSSLISV